MPTIFRRGPYRFFFFANEGDEPPHVHVERERRRAKIWLSPVQLTRTGGYSAAELGRIIRIVRENRAHLLEAWNEYFA
jgi:hypothetical protein